MNADLNNELNKINLELCSLMQKETKGSEEYNKLAEKLLKNNERLIEKTIHSFYSPLPKDDKFQVARMALVEAADKFSPEKSNYFSTYAVTTIFGKIKREEYNFSQMRNSSIQAKINAFVNKYFDDHNEYPTIDVICENTKILKQTIISYFETNQISSLNEPLKNPKSEEGNKILMDTISYKKEEKDSRIDLINIALTYLNLKDKELFEDFYVYKYTVKELKEKYQLSYQRISTIANNIKNHVKNLLSDEGMQAINTLEKINVFHKKYTNNVNNLSLKSYLNYKTNVSISSSCLCNMLMINCMKNIKCHNKPFMENNNVSANDIVGFLNKNDQESIKSYLMNDFSNYNNGDLGKLLIKIKSAIQLYNYIELNNDKKILEVENPLVYIQKNVKYSKIYKLIVQNDENAIAVKPSSTKFIPNIDINSNEFKLALEYLSEEYKNLITEILCNQKCIDDYSQEQERTKQYISYHYGKAYEILEYFSDEQGLKTINNHKDFLEKYKKLEIKNLKNTLELLNNYPLSEIYNMICICTFKNYAVALESLIKNECGNIKNAKLKENEIEIICKILAEADKEDIEKVTEIEFNRQNKNKKISSILRKIENSLNIEIVSENE